MAPLVRQQEHWPQLLIGAVWSAGPAGYAIAMAVSGRLADRLSPRALCWASLVIMAVGVGAALARPQAALFPILYSGLGLGVAGGVGMAGSVAAAAHALPGRRGAAGGAVTAAYALAALVQVPVAAALAPRLGWLGTLRAEAAALVLVAAVALLAMPKMPDTSAARVGTIGDRRVAGRPLVLTGLILELCAGGLGAAAFVNLGAYARGFGVAAALASLAITLIAAGNSAGRLVAGVAADRFGSDPVMLLVLLANAAAATLLAVAPAWPAFLAAGLLAGLGFGGAAGLISRIAASAAPEAPNAAFGYVFTGYSAGSFLGPLLLSALALSPASWLVVAAPSVAGVAVLAARRRLARVP